MEKYFFILILFSFVQIVSNLIFRKYILDYLANFEKLITEEVKEQKPTEILGFKDNKENDDV